ncbi:MAG: hypothetical protein ACP5OU_09485 [Methanothrix sp.]
MIKAKPEITKILVHLLIYSVAAPCLAIALVITWVLARGCGLLFGEDEHFVSMICFVGEVLLYIYLSRR